MTIPVNEDEYIRLLSELLACLGSPPRLKILNILSERSLCVNEISEIVGSSQTTTSRHLKSLKDHGLVRATRRGTTIEYRLNDYRLVEVMEILQLILKDRILHRARIVKAEKF